MLRAIQSLAEATRFSRTGFFDLAAVNTFVWGCNLPSDEGLDDFSDCSRNEISMVTSRIFDEIFTEISLCSSNCILTWSPRMQPLSGWSCISRHCCISGTRSPFKNRLAPNSRLSTHLAGPVTIQVAVDDRRDARHTRGALTF